MSLIPINNIILDGTEIELENGFLDWNDYGSEITANGFSHPDWFQLRRTHSFIIHLSDTNAIEGRVELEIQDVNSIVKIYNNSSFGPISKPILKMVILYHEVKTKI
ncbi:hypothetical protein [Paenibacillus polymyxa]|uniref:hypothetical protein n=1 Tax=Paenibacillus TaxID=44249 RepID=UPI002223C2F8|nr:hypothetical protein [Paenibacillus polymyxa]